MALELANPHPNLPNAWVYFQLLIELLPYAKFLPQFTSICSKLAFHLHRERTNEMANLCVTGIV